MKPSNFVRLAFVVFIAGAMVSLRLGSVAAQESRTSMMPVFEVDPGWPKLPNNWVVGNVPGIAVDRHDHIWLLHRPGTVPAAQRAYAAPSVLEFDDKGVFVAGWGGAGKGFDWPGSEHGVSVDDKDNVWIGGSGPLAPSSTNHSDDMLLKFTRQGKFLMQIGGSNTSKGNADTKSLNKPADVFMYTKTNELFVADGYGNRRVIVLDADTGAFKRMWGAFGNAPMDAPPRPAGAAAMGPDNRAPLETQGPGPQQFGGPVHAVKISNDGLVYVGDRSNRRIQVFTVDGKYVNQTFINREGPASNSVAGLAFSPDAEQRFLYVADYGNSRILVLDRKQLTVLYQFGGVGAKPGQFQGPHHIAVDSKGNLYVAEVAPGNRAQRFVFKGLSASLPANALTAQPALAPPTNAAAAPPPAAYATPVQTWPSAMANPYRLVEQWPNFEDIKSGAAIGIIPDGTGGTWLMHRSEPPILHIDASGRITKRFGDGMFVQAHGFCRDRDGNFWAGDSGPFSNSPNTAGRGFQMFKFSPEGKLLLTLGKAGVSKAGEDTFIGPTACAIAPNGDVFIADGHWPRPNTAQQDGDRIVRFTKDGKFIASYGKLGSGPGEFMGPHALAFDSQGRLFVADRSNNRVQIFDRNMNFIDEWRHFGRPSGVTILKDDTFIVADSESSRPIAGPPQAAEGGGNVIRNPGWRTGIRIGSAKDGSLKYFIPDTQPEGLGADDKGNIFAGKTGGCDIGKAGGCLQKFVRK